MEVFIAFANYSYIKEAHLHIFNAPFYLLLDLFSTAPTENDNNTNNYSSIDFFCYSSFVFLSLHAEFYRKELNNKGIIFCRRENGADTRFLYFNTSLVT